MNREVFFGGASGDSEDWQGDITSGKAPMGPTSSVAPTVLWLAHRSTQVNGDIYTVSSGKVARVAFVIGEGLFDPNHTPETLRDNIERIRDISTFLEPRTTLEELLLIPPLFGFKG